MKKVYFIALLFLCLANTIYAQNKIVKQHLNVIESLFKGDTIADLDKSILFIEELT